MSGLPEEWAACSLADIGQIVTGKTPSTKEPHFYGGNIPFIKPGDLDHSVPIFKTETFLTAAGAAEVPSLPPKSIVVTCIGNLGKVGLTTTTSATNQQINALIPDEGIDPSFVFHYCKTLKPWLEAESSATTISIVNKGIFSKAPFPLPPLAEQTRISQKLDELLAQVDTLKSRIDAIPALLKRFRQSVLAAAVSGRLTEEWRINAGVNLSANEYLLDELIEESLVGLVRSANEQSDNQNGSPYLKMNNINNDWGHNNIKLTYVSATTAELSRYQLRKGDWLFNTRNSLELVGKSCIWKGGNGFVFNNNILRLRLKEKALSEYIEIWFRSPNGQSQLNEIKSATTSVAAIYQKALMQQVVALPSLAEQTEIVRRVEQLFAFADQLKSKVQRAKSRIDHLTQSILAKAFRGELVPQDPNDEPASVLLERIQAQRAAAPKAKRGRKASA